MQQASQVLDDLVGDKAMLRRFFEEVSKQTRLSQPANENTNPAAKLVPGANNKANKIEGRVARLRAIVPGTKAVPNNPDPAQAIYRRYARIHSLVAPGADGKPKIDRIAAQLKTFGRQIEAIAKRGYAPQQANWEDIDVNKALPAIRQVEPLRTWVMQITDQIKSLSGGRNEGSHQRKMEN